MPSHRQRNSPYQRFRGLSVRVRGNLQQPPWKGVAIFSGHEIHTFVWTRNLWVEAQRRVGASDVSTTSSRAQRERRARVAGRRGDKKNFERVTRLVLHPLVGL